MKEELMRILKAGVDVNYGKLSLCNIHNYENRRTGWQVHSDNPSYLASEFYRPSQLEIAVARFLFIRRAIRNDEFTNPKLPDVPVESKDA